MNRNTVAGALFMLVLLGCGAEPRFGALGVSAAAPRATLSGRTSAQASPALELSPGCPGFVDPGVPEHVLRVSDGVPFVVSASSTGGPLALAVSGQGEVRCDSDGGSGHAPHVSIDQPGEYLVYVGALAAAQELPYALAVSPSSDAAGSGGVPIAEDTRVSVTITSEPSGATVRTPEGEVLGTTPAMFVLPVPGEQIGQERRFVLEMPGHRTAEVTGRLLGGSMVLHASLLSGTDTPFAADEPAPASTELVGSTVVPVPAPTATGELTVTTADAAVPIRDYASVEQHVEVAADCTIGRAAVVLDLDHSYVADLRVTVRAPSGTEVVLHNHRSGSRRSLATTIDWDDRRGLLHALAGQNARGRWTLAVRDSVGADTGMLTSFGLRLTCGAVAAVAAPARTPRMTPRPRPRPPAPRPAPGDLTIDPWSSPPPVGRTNAPPRAGLVVPR
jgi:subtilisin-like proprotein convertase family protein